MVLLAMAPEIRLLAFLRDSKLTFFLVQRWWQGHHHPIGGRFSGMTQQCLLATINDPDNRPGQDIASPGALSSALCVSSSASEALGFLLATLGSYCHPAPFAGYRSCLGVEPRIRLGMLVMLGSVSAPLLKMPTKKDVASSSAVGQSGKDASGVDYAEKSVDKLNVRQFCERFCIPNDVSVQLVDGEAISTEKSVDNAIYFTKEQFNARLRFFLPSLFKEFFTSPRSLRPTSIPI
ncbi:hypothetical protein CK203_055458 [Vitis vinifera]|uniref:Uncharacterized protein n=1 Tax=Vitis vinifera TaxID=29760 RepID=A0A438GJD1_VITVI|nr:hypothetical protein CK203_055458 [Vitis vinifera]